MREVAAAGSAVPADAWERYTRPASWPLWAPQVHRVDAPQDVVAAGDRGRVHGPAMTWVPFRVLDVDHEGRRWSWRVGVGPLGVRMDHGVDPDGSGSRAWVRIHAPAPLVAAYAPVARLALRRLVSP